MDDKLKKLMDQRMQELGIHSAPPPVAVGSPIFEPLPCYGVRAAEGFSEHFVDFRLQDGNRVAFAYTELTYVNFDAESSRLDLNFRDYMVCLYGQNLDGEFHDALMDCRVRWIREASEDEFAGLAGTVCVEAIEIIPPGEEEEEMAYEEEDLEQPAEDEEVVE